MSAVPNTKPTNQTKEKAETKIPTTKTPVSKKETVKSPEHPLSHLVPPDYFLEDYITRKVHGVEDLEVMRLAHEARHNVLLQGPTGSAKTTFVYAYAHKVGLPVVNIACNGGIDPRQLIGGWSPLPDGSFHFVPGDLVLGIQHGAIILLNEVNFMPPKIASIIYGLLDRRRTIYLPDAAGSDFPTSVRAHSSTFICADMNPGYQGTRSLNKAFKNRFAVKIDWGYEHAVEEQLVTSSTLLQVVEDLRKRAEVGDIETPISTNMMAEFEEFAYTDGLGYDFALANFASAFEPDEQQVVLEVFKLHNDAINLELFGGDENEAESDAEEEVEEEEIEYTE